MVEDPPRGEDPAPEIEGYISHLIAFVTLNLGASLQLAVFILGYSFLSSLSSFSYFLGCQTPPLRMTTQGMFG